MKVCDGERLPLDCPRDNLLWVHEVRIPGTITVDPTENSWCNKTPYYAWARVPELFTYCLHNILHFFFNLDDAFLFAPAEMLLLVNSIVVGHLDITRVLSTVRQNMSKYLILLTFRVLILSRHISFGEQHGFETLVMFLSKLHIRIWHTHCPWLWRKAYCCWEY